MIKYILTSFFIIYSVSAYGRPGDLDNSFGANGFATIAINNDAIASSLSIDENSEMIVGGSAFNGRWAVAKFNISGQPVSSFGIGGAQTYQFSVLGGGVVALARQGSNKIILGNDVGTGNSLIRINRFGTQDMSFGIGGRHIINFTDTQTPRATGLDVLINGKMMVTGYVRTSAAETKGFLLQLLPNGTIDKSFGSSGRILFSIPGYSEILVFDFEANEVRSKYFLAGSVCRDGPDCLQFVAKFNPNGDLDLNFGASGFAFMSYEPFTTVRFGDIAIQSDGKLVVSGNIGNGGFGTKGFVARFTSEGLLDQSFGDAGITAPILGATSSIFSSVKIDNSNRILVTGQVDSSQGLLMQFTGAGIPDYSFGQAGIVRFPSIGGSAIKIQPDGKLLVAGSRDTPNGYVFQVARFFGSPPIAQFQPVPMLNFFSLAIMAVALALIANFIGKLGELR